MTSIAGASIHATAEVEAGATVGARTRVWAYSHVRAGAVVGEDCVLGENVFVDVRVKVGSRCKIQSGALLFRGAELEDEVFVGPSACLTNDRMPRAATPDGRLKDESNWHVSGVVLRRGSSVGAHAVIVGGYTVGIWAMVGAGAVVAADVPAFALVVGSPARRIGWVCKCGTRMDSDLACPSCSRRYAETDGGLEEAP